MKFFFSIALASFTDEEGYGRFLDLHQAYEIYLNIKGIGVSRTNVFLVVNYFSFIETGLFDLFTKIRSII